MPIEKDYRMDQDCELRFEVNTSKEAELILVQGTAEIFGTELEVGKAYIFPIGSKVAVFTWHGCILRLVGKTEETYVAYETPMLMYLRMHANLEKARIKARDSHTETENASGPVIMVVGPCDVGKATLCRFLLNLAVRMGHIPIFADLDAERGSMAVPGTVGAALIEETAEIGEEFEVENPLVYNFGHLSPASNPTFFKIILSRLGATVREKMLTNKRVSESGVVILMTNWITKEGYRVITHTAQAFEVDRIIVLDSESLFNDLVHDIPFVNVVFCPKSGGVMEKTTDDRVAAGHAQIHKYFYGRRTKLEPYIFEVEYSLLQIYEIEHPAVPDSRLPANVDKKVDDHMIKLVPVKPCIKLKYHILAVTHANESAELLTSNAAGFICVLDVDEENKTVKVLSPQPEPLPRNLLVVTDLEFNIPGSLE